MKTFPIFMAAALAISAQGIYAADTRASIRSEQAAASKDPEIKNKNKDFGKASTATSPSAAKEQGEAAAVRTKKSNDADETKAEDRELERATSQRRVNMESRR